MMIGLLQSGTGIGRGRYPPIVSKGLLDARDAARAREIGVGTERGAICVEAISVAPPFGRNPVIGWLPGADEPRRALAAPPARRGRVEPRAGCAVLVEILGVGTPLAEDAGAAPTETGALTELGAVGELGVLPADAASDPPEAADCLSPRCDVPARLDSEPPTEDFSDDPSLREERPSFEPSPWEDFSEEPLLPEERPSCEPSPWEDFSEERSLREERPSFEPSPWEDFSEDRSLPEERSCFEPSPWEDASEEPSPREERPSFEPTPWEALSEDPSPREEDPSCEPSPCEWC